MAIEEVERNRSHVHAAVSRLCGAFVAYCPTSDELTRAIELVEEAQRIVNAILDRSE